MKRSHLAIIVVAVVLGAFLIYLWYGVGFMSSRTSSRQTAQFARPARRNPLPLATPVVTTTGGLPPSSPTVTVTPAQNDFERERQIWSRGLSTPISFYGKVIDEKSNPIDDASVEIGVNDKGISGTKYHKTSDSNGKFSISGVHGLALMISVSKDGYYQVKGSTGVYGYAEGMSHDGPIPTEDRPAVFRLTKAGIGAALIVNDIKAELPKNGTPVEINLSTGKVSSASQNGLRIDFAIENQTIYHTYNPYGWSARISIPNGGLVDRNDELSFTAPSDGYRDFDEIDMSNPTHKWMPQVSRRYFLKFGNGTYARIDLRMIAGNNNFVLITSYLNPTPGDRNLEFDSAKQINQ